MGQLIDGEWVKGSVSTNDKKGNFKRASSVFRNKIILITQHIYLKQVDTIYMLVTPAHGLTEHSYLEN